MFLVVENNKPDLICRGGFSIEKSLEKELLKTFFVYK